MYMLLCLGCLSEFCPAICFNYWFEYQYMGPVSRSTAVHRPWKKQNSRMMCFKQCFANKKSVANYKRRNEWLKVILRDDPRSILVHSMCSNELGISVEGSCFLFSLWRELPCSYCCCFIGCWNPHDVVLCRHLLKTVKWGMKGFWLGHSHLSETKY